MIQANQSLDRIASPTVELTAAFRSIPEALATYPNKCLSAFRVEPSRLVYLFPIEPILAKWTNSERLSLSFSLVLSV